MRLTSSGGAEIQQCYPNGSTNGQGPTNFFGFRSSNGVHPGQESQCDVGQQQPPLGETSNLGGAPYSHHMYGNTGIPGRPTFHQPPLCPPSLDNIVERGWSTGGWPASFYGNNDHLMMLQQQQVVTQESTIEENSHHLHLENKVGSAGSASASTCETLYYERPGHLLMQSEAALQSPEDGCEEAFECSAEAALMTGGGLGSCSSLLEVQPQ